MSASILLASLVASLAVEGGATCPTPSSVSSRLATMLPSDAGDGQRALIDSVPGGLRIELRDRSDRLVATKRLTGVPRCSDLAGAAAVVIASWVIELDPAIPTPSEAIPQAPPVTRAQPTAAAGDSSPWAFELGAGISASLAAGSLCLGALIDASITPGGRGAGARLSIAALGAREIPLSPGRVTWQRYALGLGAHYRLRPGNWRIDPHLEALAALLAITPGEESPIGPTSRFEPGLGAGLRAISAPGFWVDLVAQLWPLTSPLTASRNLPQFELILRIGASVGPE